MAAYPKVRVAEGQLSAAQVNANTGAGTIVVPINPGRTYTVVDCWMRAIGGSVGGATAVVLEDTAGTDIVSNAVAGLTQDAVLRAGATHSTATGLGTPAAKGKGLRIGRTVSDVTTATHLDYVILYTVDAP